MKTIVVLVLLIATVMAVPLQKKQEKELNPEDHGTATADVKRGKRQFGFQGGATGAESVSFDVNTPIGNIGLSESSSYANQNNVGLGGFRPGYPGRFGGYPGRYGILGLGSYANGFNGGFNRPFGGGLGFSGSQAGSFNSNVDFKRK